MLFGRRKRGDDALHRLRGIDGVHAGKNDVAVFGGFEKNLKRLVVADFPHHDDAGRLPQRGSQRQGKIGRIAVQFALVYRRSLVLVQKFDRISTVRT